MIPPVPANADPAWRTWALGINGALQLLTVPQGPTPLWACLEANLPPAADNLYAAVWVSDLVMAAVSDGTDWRRLDNGAAI